MSLILVFAFDSIIRELISSLAPRKTDLVVAVAAFYNARVTVSGKLVSPANISRLQYAELLSLSDSNITIGARDFGFSCTICANARNFSSVSIKRSGSSYVIWQWQHISHAYLLLIDTIDVTSYPNVPYHICSRKSIENCADPIVPCLGWGKEKTKQKNRVASFLNNWISYSSY